MNAGIRTYAVLGVMCIVSVLGMLYLADKNGYNRSNAEHAKLGATKSQEAKEKQAIEQVGINDLADQYVSALETSHALSKELDQYKAQLRQAREKRTKNENPSKECKCNNVDPERPVWPVYPAIYRMYNRSIVHPDLPPNQRVRAIDEIGDGIDAIQHCGTEETRLKIKVNKLQGVIRRSSCFIQGNKKPPQ